MMIYPDAMIAAASMIGRDWGHDGYRIDEVIDCGWTGAVLLSVVANDGGRFYVGATRWGNTVHADKFIEAKELLTEQIAKEGKL